MHIPGFTARASLEEKIEEYHTTRIPGGVPLTMQRLIRPQERDAGTHCDCGGYTGADGQTHLACYCVVY
jgi:hypothetical protein